MRMSYKKVVCSAGLAVAIGFASGCESDGNSGSTTVERSSSNAEPVAPIGQTKQGSLYQKMGGERVLRSVIDGYFDRMQKDSTLQFNQMVQQQGGNVQQVKDRYFNFIASSIGGPQEYKGEPIAIAHQGLNIDRQEFEKGMRHFEAAMQANGLSEAHQKQLMQVLRGARPAVVEQQPRQ